jgi:hypothetical protein
MTWFRIRYLGFVSLLCAPTISMAQDLVKCEKPAGNERIQSFSVPVPAAIEDAYNATVEAFVTTGFVPNASTQIANQVQWTSGADFNSLDNATRTRYIRAIVFAKGTGSVVNVSAFEEVTAGTGSGVTGTGDPLSNKNSGYGFKVWCGARRIADTLTAMAARMPGGAPPVAAAPVSSASTPGAPPPTATATPSEPAAGTYSVSFLELSDGGSSQRVAGTIVTAGFLPATLQPEIGRTFQAPDFSASSPRAVLLSDRLWHERYKALPAVAGMSIQLGGKEAVVVGVLPASFDFPSGVDLWVAKQ